ncbi:MAG TPA: glycosyltransferase family 4 protein, partial [Gemmatimonadaceae bacterium]|nr:glycosyltransferase family 4 protein [Gemmatimonadaceae bacterium]
LHIDAGREWRGGQRQVWLLAQGLRARGHEPLVVGIPDSPLLQRLRQRGIASAAVPMRADWDLRAARRIRALIRAWRPDVVHAHDARAHAIAMAALIGSRIPLVVTRRVAFTPKSVRFKYGRRVARFIAISTAVSEAMIRGGVDPRRIDVVFSGVPAPPPLHPRDWRAECEWPPNTVLCGVVGAMTAEKGIGLLADVATKLPPGARSRARLVLLGGQSSGRCNIGGIEAYRAGFVDEIHAAMAGLDVLLHPSSAEGLGTAVIDAMALGVPPVAFAVGGLVELVQHERNGLLVRIGDLAGFAEAAARLILDERLRRRLGGAGPVRAAEFDVDSMVEGTERTYMSVIASRVPAGV